MTDQWSEARDRAVEERRRSPEATEVEKALAAFLGAAEGFVEEANRADLPRLVGRTIDTTRETGRGVVEAVRVERPIPADVSQGTAASTAEPTAQVQPAPAGAEPAENGQGAVAQRAEALMERAEVYVEAAGETSRRALEAPTAMKSHVKVTAREVGRDAAKSAAGFGLTGVFGIFALAFLSVAVAVGLSLMFGSPWGSIIVGAAYAVAAGVAFAMGRRGIEDAKRDARNGVDHVRNEAKGIMTPLRNVKARRTTGNVENR